MMLGELIAFLEAQDPTKVVPVGFNSANSYRGYYEDLAFSPARNVTVATMLEVARGSLGKTFQGYKGGDYHMRDHTRVWLARYGREGESIGPVLLAYMMGTTDHLEVP